MTFSTIKNNRKGLARNPLIRKAAIVVITVALTFFGVLNLASRTEFLAHDIHFSDAHVGDIIDFGNKQENNRIPSILPVRSNADTKAIYRDQVANLSDDWTSEKEEIQLQVFRRRASNVRTSCKFVDKIPGYFKVKKNRLLNNLRWVKKHKLIWCPIFKSASTTWVKNLLLLAGEKVLNKSFHGRVRELYPRPEDPKEEQEVLDSSMKMIIVRHPLDRLLSAYRDKMLRVKHPCDPYIKLQKNIMDKYKDPNGDELPRSTVLLHMGLNGTHCLNQVLGLNLKVPYGAGDPLISFKSTNMTFTHPTFSQFLLMVRDDLARFWRKKGNASLNLHWRPYWITCGPCKLNYDVIAHVETLGPDQEFVIRKLGLENILYNTHTHASTFDNYNDTSNAMPHYFSRVPRKLLQDIVKYYKPDFNIFGYNPNSFLSLAKE